MVVEANGRDLHPRPQLTRDRWISLDGPWGFAFDDDDVGRDAGWERQADVFSRTIIVPYPPESPASGVADPGFHPVVWYRRTFQVEPKDRPGRLLLHFGAVDYRAEVWIDGQFAGSHTGGQTPFTIDITPFLREGPEHAVVVRAADDPQDLAQPRGKQDWHERPHRIWYERTTGIWQPVWLEPVPKVYIKNIRWTPDLDRGLLGMAVTLDGAGSGPLHLHLRCTWRGQVLAENTYSAPAQLFRTEIAFQGLERLAGADSDAILWSPDHPNLVDVELSLRHGDAVLDAVQSYVGLRSAAAGDGHFLLNGRPYYLRLVLEQGYWPQTHLAAPDGEALRQEAEWVKRLGFNGVRIHQKVEDPRFLYWCDRLGLLVWGEMANAYAFSPRAVSALVREWIEVLERDCSHPCIVTWVPLNESWGVPNLANDPAQRAYVQTVYSLTKTLDPTRPVIGNDGWEYLAGDMIGIHDYTFHGEDIIERYGSFQALQRTVREVQPYYRPIAMAELRAGTPVVLSEWGGLSYRPAEDADWFGYGTVTSAAEFHQKYAELIDAILACPTLSGFCYTQLTDTGQERNGLLTAEREPKISPDTICRLTGRPSAAIPGDITRTVQESRGVSPFASPEVAGE